MITGPGWSSGGRGAKATGADDEGVGAALLAVALEVDERAADDEGAVDDEDALDDEGAVDDERPAAEPRGESPDANTIASTAATIAKQPSTTQTIGCGRRERLGTRQFHPSGRVRVEGPEPTTLAICVRPRSP